MDEMVSKIRESGKVYRGIKKLYKDLHFEKPYLADYVRRKMMELAEENDDL